MEDLFKKYLRWRHSRGYGVHSPYAYRFVTDVLRPGDYGFYAYHDIDHDILMSKGKSQIDSQNLRLLYRIIVFLNTSRLIISGDKEPSVKLLAKVSRLPLLDFQKIKDNDFKKGDLVIITSGNISKERFETVVNNQVPVLALDPSKQVRALLANPLEKGLLFNGTKKSLLIPRHEMAYISYDILF